MFVWKSSLGVLPESDDFGATGTENFDTWCVNEFDLDLDWDRGALVVDSGPGIADGTVRGMDGDMGTLFILVIVVIVFLRWLIGDGVVETVEMDDDAEGERRCDPK